MSKPIANKGLRRLCREYCSDGMCLIDLAILCDCDRTAIYYYLAGRSMSKLERKMARLFKLDVKDLRRKLGLKQNTERKPIGRKS